MFTIIKLLCIATLFQATMADRYSMYVWTKSYDSTVPSCSESDFLTWNTSDTICFTNSWNTIDKRTWLWNTCQVPGREITDIYLSGIHWVMQQAYLQQDTTFQGIDLVRETLKDGHTQVPGLRIYALFSDSNFDVTEKDKVAWIVYYNEYCATSVEEQFDGYAVNNEAYDYMVCPHWGYTDEARLSYLDKLMMIKTEAARQSTRTLLTHYSIVWYWGRCNSMDYNLTWNGKTQPATYHMIDIFDSVDIQVAATNVAVIKTRLEIAGLQHGRETGKRMFTTLYLNKIPPRPETTFFQSTEAAMWKVVDEFDNNGILDAKPCLHYFRGVYSSGGSIYWPIHNGWRQINRFPISVLFTISLLSKTIVRMEFRQLQF